MKRAVRKCTSLLLLAAALFSSCGARTTEGQSGEFLMAEELTYKHYDEYSAAKVEIPLEKDEVIFDVMEEEGGYAVLTGVPMDFDAHGYYSRVGITIHSSRLRHFDESWTEQTARREVFEGDAETARLIDGDYMMVAAPSKELDSVTLSENGVEEYYVDGCYYEIYKNGHRRTRLGNGEANSQIGGFRTCQFLTKNDAVIAVTRRDDTREKFLFIAPYDRTELHAIEIAAPKDKQYTSTAIEGVINMNGKIYALLAVSGKKAGGLLVPISEETTELDLSTGIFIDTQPQGMCASDGEIGYFMSGAELYATDGTHTEKLANVEEAGFNAQSDIERIRPLYDGRILMVIEHEIVELTETDEEYVSVSQSLALGYIGHLSDDLRIRIERFNKADNDMTVNLKQYGDRDKLNLAILSQEVDLLADTDLLYLRNYADKGYLAPLEEVCPALFENHVLTESIVEAARFRGKSYFLPRLFTLSGYTVTDEYKAIPLTSLAECLEYVEEVNPEGIKRSVNIDEVDFLICRRLDEWIDWDTNTCHFDDENMIAALEFCNRCASSVEEAIAHESAEIVLNVTYMYGYQDTEVFVEAGEGGTALFFPLPSDTHGGAEIWTPYFLAVAETEKREDCKTFMNFVFLEDTITTLEVQDELWEFPINAEELEAYLTPREPDGIAESMKEKTMALLEAQAIFTRETISSADHYVYLEDTLKKVICEEALRFFKGEITAEKAAAYIQNRVQLYLDEQG